MDFKKFFELDLDFSALRHLGLTAPLTLAVAVAASIGAGWGGKQLMQQNAAVQAQVQLMQQPSNPDELQAVAKSLQAIAPAMKVEVVGNSLMISGKEGSYPTWLYTVSTVPSLQGSLVWTTKSMCVNTCGNGVAYRADLAATKQVLVKAN